MAEKPVQIPTFPPFWHLTSDFCGDMLFVFLFLFLAKCGAVHYGQIPLLLLVLWFLQMNDLNCIQTFKTSAFIYMHTLSHNQAIKCICLAGPASFSLPDSCGSNKGVLSFSQNCISTSVSSWQLSTSSDHCLFPVFIWFLLFFSTTYFVNSISLAQNRSFNFARQHLELIKQLWHSKYFCFPHCCSIVHILQHSSIAVSRMFSWHNLTHNVQACQT